MRTEDTHTASILTHPAFAGPAVANPPSRPGRKPAGVVSLAVQRRRAKVAAVHRERIEADEAAAPAVPGIDRAKVPPAPQAHRPGGAEFGVRVQALTHAGFDHGQASLIGMALAMLQERVSEPAGVLTGTSAVRAYLALHMGWRDREAFGCLFLDTQYAVIGGLELLFEGTLHTVQVHPREIARRALALNARAVILVHNHPSGHAQFSDEDLALTRTVKRALELVGVLMLDHVLVAGACAVSAAEAGLMK